MIAAPSISGAGTGKGILVRAVSRLSTAAWVEGSGSLEVRTARAMAFSSTWAVAAYAAAGALGAAVAMAVALRTDKTAVTKSALAAAICNSSPLPPSRQRYRALVARKAGPPSRSA